jgi:lipoate-protein ligase A
MVFVGGILLDFNYRAMSRILKVPDEKLRDKVYKTMEENLTTMKKELGTIPSRDQVIKVLKEKFENKVGKLEVASLNPQIIEKMKQLEAWMTSEEFLLKKTPRIPSGVKIREGVEVLYGLHKARGGLIRTAEEVSESRIEDVTISGDFTFYPKEGLTGLEESLENAPLNEEKIIERVETFYEEKKVESPGVESKDIAQTILNPLKNPEIG